MTRDEILAMPAGREMDALIAEKVMGWIIHPHKTHWQILAGGVYFNTRSVGDFEPSTDIFAAWEVVEKMNPFEIELLREKDGICECLIWLENESHPRENIRAESMPLAICRAALLAVME